MKKLLSLFVFSSLFMQTHCMNSSSSASASSASAAPASSPAAGASTAGQESYSETITIITSDNQSFSVDRNIIMQSKTISNPFEDLEMECNGIPLPNITASDF